jgi:hypothetical protein
MVGYATARALNMIIAKGNMTVLTLSTPSPGDPVVLQLAPEDPLRRVLPTGPVGLVNLGEIPNGLNAEELERFLRKMARRSAVSVVLGIKMDWQTGLRKRTRGDEGDHQAAIRSEVTSDNKKSRLWRTQC